jgi:adenylate cyclase
MTATIFATGGTVEKYIGDAILAVFGVPEPGSNDAGNALDCALQMLAALESWNEERAAVGATALAIGIGVNHGSVVLGDVGSAQAMSFTVIGDTVNTASRLQSLTRALKTPLVVGDPVVASIRTSGSETTAALLTKLRDGGEQVLRGRTAGMRIWVQ